MRQTIFNLSPTARRLLAAVMALLFLQGFVGTLWHLDAADHYWCAEHQHVTHDDHGAAHSDTAHLAPTPSKTDGRFGPLAPPSPDEDEHSDCEWLTWLHNDTTSIPPAYAQLLNLPPPADRRATLPIPSSQTAQPHPIGLRHLSPNNSPPRA